MNALREMGELIYEISHGYVCFRHYGSIIHLFFFVSAVSISFALFPLCAFLLLWVLFVLLVVISLTADIAVPTSTPLPSFSPASSPSSSSSSSSSSLSHPSSSPLHRFASSLLHFINLIMSVPFISFIIQSSSFIQQAQ